MSSFKSYYFIELGASNASDRLISRESTKNNRILFLETGLVKFAPRTSKLPVHCSNSSAERIRDSVGIHIRSRVSVNELQRDT